ncbi:MAG: hypothetical protein Q4G13_05220 [Moraxella sp.]|nr:hypothetical protein [Moraxella sp.]
MPILLLLVLVGAIVLVYAGLCRRRGGLREIFGLHEPCQDVVMSEGVARRVQFFYVLPCCEPVGPVSCKEIVKLAKDPIWQERVQISEAGTEEWLNFEYWSVRYRQQGNVMA